MDRTVDHAHRKCAPRRGSKKKSVWVGEGEISPECLGLQVSVEYFSNTQEALGSMPTTARREKERSHSEYKQAEEK